MSIVRIAYSRTALDGKAYIALDSIFLLGYVDTEGCCQPQQQEGRLSLSVPAGCETAEQGAEHSAEERATAPARAKGLTMEYGHGIGFSSRIWCRCIRLYHLPERQCEPGA
jgi:hypothetical protein